MNQEIIDNVFKIILALFALFQSKEFISFIKRKRKQGFKPAIEGNIELDHLLFSFNKIRGVKKAVLIKTNNDGAVPRPGGNLYATIIAPFIWTDNIQRQKLDVETQKFVLDCFLNRTTQIAISQLQVGGYMWQNCSHNEIELMEWHYIVERPDQFLFVAIDFHSDHEISPEVREQITTTINQIKKVIV